MRSICPSCMREVDSHIIHKVETFHVCGEATEVDADVRVCDACGEEIVDLELDDVTLMRAYAKYRARHGLLGPDEVLAIREQYSLTQREFARLLGWSPATVNRYERTGCMSSAQDQVLRALRDPQGAKRLLDSRTPVLTREEAAKYSVRLGTGSRPGAAEQATEETPCPVCGRSVGQADNFCKHCGVLLHKQEE